MEKILEGKIALITGASSGIGKALSIGFAKYGADIIIVGRNQERMDKTKNEVENLSRRAITVAADIQKYENCAKAVEAGKKFGNVNILVNNAGYSRLYPITHRKLTPEIIDNILKTNILGPYYLSHAIIPHMIEIGGGTILNTGSLAINSAMSGWAAYSMSKHSLIGFTECLAVELKPYNININTIMPRMVRTPMLHGMKEDVINMMNPMNPEDLVDFFTFFASKQGKQVTGINVNVDIILKVLEIAKKLPNGQGLSWEALNNILKEKINTNDFKQATQCQKLIDFLLK